MTQTETQTRRPVVFIHGLWLHASSWEPWADRFSAAGYAPVAPGWPGDADSVDGSRADPDSIANHGIDDVTEHYAAIIASLPAPPVLIGHSFGGMIAEKLLGQGIGAAAVAIDAAQIKGVLPLPLSALRSTLPVFKNPGNAHRAVSLTPEQFRYSFGNAVSAEESDALFKQWAIPAPGKPLFEAAAANFSLHSPAKVDTDNADRGPLLLVMGGQDHTVPEAITKSTLKQYRGSGAVTDLVEFPDRGHSLTIDSGWGAVADQCLSWLATRGL
jgi:pimeloyl-ACP methyl ester carboxylesterase